jgi:succinate-semialdehyde dehydrogenase/glutarate-semialdehyde dehydrogenase
MGDTAVAHTRLETLDAVPKLLFIGGKWRPAAGHATFPVIDPATGEALCDVADASVDDAGEALQCAADGQGDWARTAPRQRSEILRRAFELLLERTDMLSLLITMEMGKPLAESRGEVAYAADFLRWFSEEAVRIGGDFTRTPDGLSRTLVMRQPVGPCLLVTPWNFPLAMGTRKIGPALAAGCTVVLKPAPQTPLSSLALAAVFEDAGLPAGVLNIVPTSRAPEVVEGLLRSGALRKLSFTGSTAVGRRLLELCGPLVIRSSMELGGNAPFIVFADADLDVALDAAMKAKMRNMGEACTAANRFFVHASVAEAFSRRFAERMGAMRVGRGDESGVDVGPLIDRASLEKVSALVADAVARGATVLTGGAVRPGPGFFYEPTVLANVDPGSDMASTEIFGPVAAIQVFTDDEEVVYRANDTQWGLVGYVFTQDIDRALSVCERLDVGMVGLNAGVVSNPAVPFGGMKQSGLGREGGRVGIDDYLEYKLIAMPVRDSAPHSHARQSRSAAR